MRDSGIDLIDTFGMGAMGGFGIDATVYFGLKRMGLRESEFLVLILTGLVVLEQSYRNRITGGGISVPSSGSLPYPKGARPMGAS
jgi:hypothetical protein